MLSLKSQVQPLVMDALQLGPVFYSDGEPDVVPVVPLHDRVVLEIALELEPEPLGGWDGGCVEHLAPPHDPPVPEFESRPDHHHDGLRRLGRPLHQRREAEVAELDAAVGRVQTGERANSDGSIGASVNDGEKEVLLVL